MRIIPGFARTNLALKPPTTIFYSYRYSNHFTAENMHEFQNYTESELTF